MVNDETQSDAIYIPRSSAFESRYMVTSARFGYHVDLLIRLGPSSHNGFDIKVCDDLIVSPDAYFVPGYKKKRSYIAQVQPWRVVKHQLPNDNKNRSIIAMIDADIRLSIETLMEAFATIKKNLLDKGMIVSNAELAFLSAGFMPYNLTATIAKFLVGLHIVNCIEKASKGEGKIIRSIMSLKLSGDEDEDFKIINSYIAGNKDFRNNWKLEIEERRAIVHRMVLSKEVEY